jgi:hypothetical protein
MNVQLGATLVAAVATTAGLFASPSSGKPTSCSKPLACSVSLTATGPSPSRLTAPAASYLTFGNADSVPHTIVFANGLCSFALAAGESGGPGGWEIGVQHPDCTGNNFTYFVGNYPYTVDGTFAGTVVTTPLRRVVTLTARTHTIRHGTRLTLHGRVSWLNYNPMLPREQFRVIVLARRDGRHAFVPLSRGRVWSSQPYEARATIEYGWKRIVHPGAKTTYIAEVTAKSSVWSIAKSRPFAVRIRK